MEMRHSSPLGKDTSLLGFGCMRFPLRQDGKEVDYPLAEALVDRAIAGGVNYFDTAWPYHEGVSESVIGKILAKYPRNSFYLADKAPTWEIRSARDAERIFAEQLRKCRVEYFDFYLLHCLTVNFYKIAQQAGLYDLLRKKKEQGLIRHLGFSFHDSVRLLEQIVADHEWDFAQIQLNYIDWDVIESERQYNLLTEHGIPVVIMEPVRGGSLATLNPEALSIFERAAPAASPASWAIRFAASLPNVITVLSGMSNMRQVEDNLHTMTPFVPLSETEHDTIRVAATAFKASGAIACTGCRYCMDCPSGVNIPRVFAIYNHYCTSKSRIHFDHNYRSLKNTEQADQCTTCGECMQHCPQGIAIPDKMREIAEFVDR